jgi:hypothetical protein
MEQWMNAWRRRALHSSAWREDLGGQQEGAQEGSDQPQGHHDRQCGHRLELADYAWDHAVISDEVYGAIKKECTFPDDGNESDKCQQAWSDFFSVMRDIDLYSLYTPACTDAMANASRTNSSSSSSAARRRSWKLADTPLAVRLCFLFCRSITYNYKQYICKKFS